MRIGLLNSGGDCPGLNAVIYGVVGACARLGAEVIGFKDGFEGLLHPEDHVVLTEKETQGILALGGTILGSTNRGHFGAKSGGRSGEIPREILGKARQNMESLALDALIVVGGDGSLSTACKLYKEGFPIIGVPKTIDNDLQATSMTFGFDSAVSCVVDGLDRLHTTTASHKRVMVVEVMGRHAGWIALWGGIAGAANVILIPEISFNFDAVAEAIRRREIAGDHSTMIVVAEGAIPQGDNFAARKVSGKGETRLGGIGEIVCREIEQRTGRDVRTCVLGHLQRGGQPTQLDRILGVRFGVKAVELAEKRQFGQMVSYQSYSVGSVAIEKAVHKIRRVDPLGEIVHTARSIGISFGDGQF